MKGCVKIASIGVKMQVAGSGLSVPLALARSLRRDKASGYTKPLDATCIVADSEPFGDGVLGCFAPMREEN